MADPATLCIEVVDTLMPALARNYKAAQAQVAKKAAMGPRHDIAALSGAVAEPWLSVVIKDAAAAERSGWFWTYKLDSVQVS